MARWLVADIGGTNARFAHCPVGGGQLADLVTYDTTSASTVVALAEAYVDRMGAGRPAAACIASAGPISGDRCVLTNSSIDFSIHATKRALGLRTLLVVNDFAAVARAVPQVPFTDLVPIGDATPRLDRVAIAVGPGTGLGVATIVKSGADSWTVLPGEGGHVALSALQDDEIEVVRELRRRFGFASAEMVLSGPGLSRLFKLLSRIHGWPHPASSPAPKEIVQAACVHSEPHAVATLAMFCGLLGTVAANAALTVGADGGVFLGGGILRRIPDFLQESTFRTRFNSHPHAADYLKPIATVLISHPEPGLMGAMHLLIDHARCEPTT